MTLIKILWELLVAIGIVSLALLALNGTMPVIFALYGLAAVALLLFLLSLYEGD
jgi:hypothetical protein